VGTQTSTQYRAHPDYRASNTTNSFVSKKPVLEDREVDFKKSIKSSILKSIIASVIVSFCLSVAGPLASSSSTTKKQEKEVWVEQNMRIQSVLDVVPLPVYQIRGPKTSFPRITKDSIVVRKGNMNGAALKEISDRAIQFTLASVERHQQSDFFVGDCRIATVLKETPLSSSEAIKLSKIILQTIRTDVRSPPEYLGSKYDVFVTEGSAATQTYSGDYAVQINVTINGWSRRYSPTFIYLALVPIPWIKRRRIKSSQSQSEETVLKQFKKAEDAGGVLMTPKKENQPTEKSKKAATETVPEEPLIDDAKWGEYAKKYSPELVVLVRHLVEEKIYNYLKIKCSKSIDEALEIDREYNRKSNEIFSKLEASVPNRGDLPKLVPWGEIRNPRYSYGGSALFYHSLSSMRLSPEQKQKRIEEVEKRAIENVRSKVTDKDRKDLKIVEDYFKKKYGG